VAASKPAVLIDELLCGMGQAGKQLNWIVGLTKLNLNLSIQSTQSHTPLHNQSINRVIQLIDKIELIAFSF
jgi:hypothetical protein